VLVELSVMEQRYQAVLAVVQDGWKVIEVAERLGVPRQAAGIAGLDADTEACEAVSTRQNRARRGRTADDG
jgi:hypothetical protein